MQNVLILGAHGQIARLVRQRLLTETDAHLTLYLRHAERLTGVDSQRETVIEGDVNDYATLLAAVRNQDLVYANLGGQFEPLAKNIVRAMTAAGVNRLIYVTGLGLYHEVPGSSRRVWAVVRSLNRPRGHGGYATSGPVDRNFTRPGDNYSGRLHDQRTTN